MATKQKRATHTIERERKFLVTELPAGILQRPHSLIEQGYLAIERGSGAAAEVRIRRTGRRLVLTVKRGRGAARDEREISLPPRNAKFLWPLTIGRRIAKTRYRIPYRGLTIELDVYRGKLRGLVVVEVEFASLSSMRHFDPPSWFGREVTGQKRYANQRLAVSGWTRIHNAAK